MENVHRSSGVCGVGPADSTGNPSVTYWPGGTRSSFPAGARCRWRKPREAGLIAGQLLSARGPSRGASPPSPRPLSPTPSKMVVLPRSPTPEGTTRRGGVPVQASRQPLPMRHGGRDAVSPADDPAVAPAVRAGLSYASGPGRWVLLVTVLGSAMASIDATVVGFARPAIGRDFGASLTTPADYHAVAPGVLLRPPA